MSQLQGSSSCPRLHRQIAVTNPWPSWGLRLSGLLSADTGTQLPVRNGISLPVEVCMDSVLGAAGMRGVLESLAFSRRSLKLPD